jgi:phosphatidylinositol kinase/protein kinase (PI-3  family)
MNLKLLNSTLQNYLSNYLVLISVGMLMMIYFFISNGPSSTIKCNWKHGVGNSESRRLQVASI